MAEESWRESGGIRLGATADDRAATVAFKERRDPGQDVELLLDSGILRVRMFTVFN